MWDFRRALARLRRRVSARTISSTAATILSCLTEGLKLKRAASPTAVGIASSGDLHLAKTSTRIPVVLRKNYTRLLNCLRSATL